MHFSTSAAKPTNSRKMLELLVFGFILLTGASYFSATQFQDFLGSALILFAALIPAAVWLAQPSGGIPIFPTAAILYWLYFGLPSMRGVGERAGYSPAHVLDADIVVALFLFVATAVWSQFARPKRFAKPKAKTKRTMNTRAVVGLVMIGLSLGVVFYVFLYSSFSDLAGNGLGIIRAVLMAPMLLACYFLGYGQAKGMFSGLQFVIALIALAVVLVLQIGGLQLIGGATELGAALLGYIYTARRVPWIPAIIVAVLISVLQAGKAEVREQYANVDVTAPMTPKLITDWLTIGTSAMADSSRHQSVADRASLLNQLIRVVTWTPDHVPYLNGETYTYLPTLLVPRIINPNRAPTQIVMNLLDVRYGFLTRRQTLKTAVGVNIIPEAFANFGYVGVVLVAMFFGAFTGYFTRISISEEATSLPTLLAIAAMVNVVDMEADLSYLVATFFQSSIAISVFYYTLHFVFGRQPIGSRLQETL